MSTDQSQITQWLTAGIDAYKAGQKEKAYDLLLQLISHDEHHEEGWFWLSQTIDDIEEKRICLENVLTINPDHAEAGRLLHSLTAANAPTAAPPIDFEPFPETRPLAPPATPTSSDWAYDPSQPQPSPELNYQQRSSYQDVWSSTDPLCGYCALVVAQEASQCPRCHHKLFSFNYRYPERTLNLLTYVGLSLVTTFFFFLQTMGTQATTHPLIWYFQLGIALILALTLAGSFFRNLQAHLVSVVMNITIFFITLNDALAFIGQSYHIVLDLYYGQLNSIIAFVSLAAIIVGVAFTGGDFAKDKISYLAKLDKGINGSHHFYQTGRTYAQRGLWAKAILHYQQATGKAPLRANYQRTLGEAYARLRFYDRSLDILQTAYKNANHPDVQLEIEKLITYVTKKQAEEASYRSNL